MKNLAISGKLPLLPPNGTNCLLKTKDSKDWFWGYHIGDGQFEDWTGGNVFDLEAWIYGIEV